MVGSPAAVATTYPVAAAARTQVSRQAAQTGTPYRVSMEAAAVVAVGTTQVQHKREEAAYPVLVTAEDLAQAIRARVAAAAQVHPVLRLHQQPSAVRVEQARPTASQVQVLLEQAAAAAAVEPAGLVAQVAEARERSQEVVATEQPTQAAAAVEPVTYQEAATEAPALSS